MLRVSVFLLLALFMPGEAIKTVTPSAAPIAVQPDGPLYAADGQLRFPEHYREWIFLTSGLDMSYEPKPEAAGHTMFRQRVRESNSLQSLSPDRKRGQTRP